MNSTIPAVALLNQADLSSAALDSLAVQIAVMDRHGVICYVNRAWHDFGCNNGMPADYPWVGVNYLMACQTCEPNSDIEADAAAAYAGILSVLDGAATVFLHEYPCHSPTEKHWFMMRVGLMQGMPDYFVISHHAITARVLAEQEVRQLAFYDPLTNLPNRRLLMDRLKQASASSLRSGQHGALMYLDLDHFKQLNDRLGHDMGDELLRQVATRLQSCVREVDSVARLGGDEFVVLLEALSLDNLEATAQAELVANKILRSLGQAYTLQGTVYSSTPSIGVVVFLQDHESMDALIRRADAAMYQAKVAGGNSLQFHNKFR